MKYNGNPVNNMTIFIDFFFQDLKCYEIIKV